MTREERIVGAGFGLGDQRAGDDIEHVLEQAAETQRLRRLLGVGARARREDQLAAGQGGHRRRQRRIGDHAGAVDIVDEGEERVGFDAVGLHQSLQRRAVARVVELLQRASRQPVEAVELHDVERDARVDLRPEVGAGGIQRVVEVEHPGVDVGEIVERAGLHSVQPRHSGARVGENPEPVASSPCLAEGDALRVRQRRPGPTSITLTA